MRQCLARPLLFCNWLAKEYEQVETEALRQFVQARLKVFYEEELDVPLVVFNQVALPPLPASSNQRTIPCQLC